MIDQMPRTGMTAEPRIEQLEMVLDLIEDQQSGPFQSPIVESTESTPSPSQTTANQQICSTDPQTSFQDPSSALSGITDLLRSHGDLSISRQIHIYLRLQTSLKKVHILVDPLKALFQLILRKASSLSIYVLMVIAFFYARLGKHQEELEVWIVASKKMDRLDVPLKYSIQEYMGLCYEDLGLLVDSLDCHTKACNGRGILLGRSHEQTIRSFRYMIDWNTMLERPADVIKLCDKVCPGQDFAADLGIETNLNLQRNRCLAYARTGDTDRANHMQNCIQSTLDTYKRTSWQDDDAISNALTSIGLAQSYICGHDTALDFFKLALEGFTKSTNSIMMLRVRIWISLAHVGLGHNQTTWKLLIEAHLEQLKTLSLNHEDIAITETYIRDFASYEETLNIPYYLKV